MANCSSCNAELKKDAKFCTECGALVQETVEEIKEEVKEEVKEAVAEVVEEPKLSKKEQKALEKAAEKEKKAAEEAAKAAEQEKKAAEEAAKAAEPVTYAPVAEEPAPVAPPVFEITESALPKKFRPLKTGQWMFMTFIMVIPVIGWIYTLICALSNGVNRNRRGYCRAVIYWFLIGLLLLLIAAVVGYFVLYRGNEEMFKAYIDQITGMFQGGLQ